MLHRCSDIDLRITALRLLNQVLPLYQTPVSTGQYKTYKDKHGNPINVVDSHKVLMFVSEYVMKACHKLLNQPLPVPLYTTKLLATVIRGNSGSVGVLHSLDLVVPIFNLLRIEDSETGANVK